MVQGLSKLYTKAPEKTNHCRKNVFPANTGSPCSDYTKDMHVTILVKKGGDGSDI